MGLGKAAQGFVAAGLVVLADVHAPVSALFCCGAATGSVACARNAAERGCAPHALSDWFVSLPWPAAVAYVVVSVTLVRCTYFFAWKMCEGACNVAGLGYEEDVTIAPPHACPPEPPGPPPAPPATSSRAESNDAGDGVKGEPGCCGERPQIKVRWDGISNVNVYQVELAGNFRTLLNNWNIATSRWLRRCSYDRWREEAGLGNAAAQLAAMIQSAVWHGPFSFPRSPLRTNPLLHC